MRFQRRGASTAICSLHIHLSKLMQISGKHDLLTWIWFIQHNTLFDLHINNLGQRHGIQGEGLTIRCIKGYIVKQKRLYKCIISTQTWRKGVVEHNISQIAHLRTITWHQGVLRTLDTSSLKLLIQKQQLALFSGLVQPGEPAKPIIPNCSMRFYVGWLNPRAETAKPYVRTCVRKCASSAAVCLRARRPELDFWICLPVRPFVLDNF